MPHWSLERILCPHCHELAFIEEWGTRQETRHVFYIERSNSDNRFWVDSDLDDTGDYDLQGYFCGYCGTELAGNDDELGQLLIRIEAIDASTDTPNETSNEVINTVQEIE